MPTRTANSSGRRVSAFARSLWLEWQCLNQPEENARVVLAVSGGADSSALLLAFDELLRARRLALEIIVAHLDHGLRGAESLRDARWVARLAEISNFKFEIGKVDGLHRSGNLEQAAREARYRFLEKVAVSARAEIIVTAHTQDDQAETMLLSLLRGSGAEGLTGMEAVRRLEASERAVPLYLSRPLLSWARRADTVAYCRERKVRFRVDRMNVDENFARVRARRKLIPLLETFNSRAVEALTRTAALLRDDNDVLRAQAMGLLEAARSPNDPNTVRASLLRDAPSALRRRALRQWIGQAKGDLKRLTLAHLLAVEKLMGGEQGGRVAELPGKLEIERRKDYLHLRVLKKVEKGGGQNYNP